MSFSAPTNKKINLAYKSYRLKRKQVRKNLKSVQSRINVQRKLSQQLLLNGTDRVTNLNGLVLRSRKHPHVVTAHVEAMLMQLLSW